MNRLDSDDIQVLCLVKGEEKFLFMYADTQANRKELLRRLGVFAAEPDLAFTWRDAAVLTKKIREGAK